MTTFTRNPYKVKLACILYCISTAIAGVGRSGTYIVIDTMLERLKNGDDTLDIYGHVSLLRTQRPYMVQTEDQYFFIHEAVAEALLCGVTEIKVDKLHSYVQELCSLVPEDEAGHTHMEVQFKVLLCAE